MLKYIQLLVSRFIGSRSLIPTNPYSFLKHYSISLRNLFTRITNTVTERANSLFIYSFLLHSYRYMSAICHSLVYSLKVSLFSLLPVHLECHKPASCSRVLIVLFLLFMWIWFTRLPQSVESKCWKL